MSRFLIRRILTIIPTLLVISFVVFAVLDLSPTDPVGNLPLTVPPAVRAQIRERLGATDPFLINYVKWLRHFLINEPVNALEAVRALNCPVRSSVYGLSLGKREA